MAAVAISALTLWDGHRERVRSEEKSQASARKEDSRAAALVLKSTPSKDGDRLTIGTQDADQAIQSQTILFPTQLGLAPVDTAGDPRIEADWFASALKRARKAAGVDEAAAGDQRLPIAITTRFVVDGDPHEAHAVYDIGYTLEGRFLGGSAVRMRGMSLIATTTAAKAGQRIDGLWQQRHPAVTKKQQ